MQARRENSTVCPSWFSFAPLAFVFAILLLDVVAIAGVVGRSGQAAIIVTCVIVFAASVESTVALGVFVLNATSRHCREALSDVSDVSDADSADAPTDPKASTLSRAVDSSRQMEAHLGDQFRTGACDAEDLLRAKAIRLKAEIDFIRHKTVPRTWADTCRQAFMIESLGGGRRRD